jgi:hypothetical protein
MQRRRHKISANERNNTAEDNRLHATTHLSLIAFTCIDTLRVIFFSFATTTPSPSPISLIVSKPSLLLLLLLPMHTIDFALFPPSVRDMVDVV